MHQLELVPGLHQYAITMPKVYNAHLHVSSIVFAKDGNAPSKLQILLAKLYNLVVKDQFNTWYGHEQWPMDREVLETTS